MTTNTEQLNLWKAALEVAFDQTCSVGRPNDWKLIKDALASVNYALTQHAPPAEGGEAREFFAYHSDMGVEFFNSPDAEAAAKSLCEENLKLERAEAISTDEWADDRAESIRWGVVLGRAKFFDNPGQEGEDSGDYKMVGYTAPPASQELTGEAGTLTVAQAEDWAPMAEDPYERKMFDDTLQEHGSVTAAICWQLRIMARSHPQGSFAQQLAVMANEVAKMPYDVSAIQEQAQQPSEPTVLDNSQEWAGMGGDIAFHLIERHANGWADIKKMMDEWLAANQVAQQPSGGEVGWRSLPATLDRLAAWLRNPANADGCETLALSFAEWCQAVVSARTALLATPKPEPLPRLCIGDSHMASLIESAIQGHASTRDAMRWLVRQLATKPEPLTWQPIETAPDNTDGIVVVRWLDGEGNEHHDLDYTEDGTWRHWHDRAEHVEMIGGHGFSYSPPYAQWLPLSPTGNHGITKGEA